MTQPEQNQYLTLRIPMPDQLGIHAVFILLLVLASLLIYLPALDGEFLYSWDDQRYVTDNYLVKDLSPDGLKAIFTVPYFGTYIPITTLSLAIDYQLWGLDPYGFHLTSIVVHTLNGVLVYILLLLLLQGAGLNVPVSIVAGIGAFLFLLHPVQVEIVVWVSQRKAVLGLLFTLLAFLAHIRSSRDGASGGWLVLAWLLILLAVLSKAVSVGAPFCFIVYDIFWARKTLPRAVLRNIVPVLIGIGGALLGVLTQSDVGAVQDFYGGTLITHLQVIFIAIWDYVPTLIFPNNMNALYLYPVDETYIRIGETVLGLIVFFGSLGVALYDLWRWRRDRRPPLILLTVVWVWTFYAPVSNIVPMPMLRADRYMYVPAIMIFALFGVLLVKVFQWIYEQRSGWLFPATILILFAGAWMLSHTTLNRDVWRNSETLWLDHLKDYPESTSGLLNLGVYYFKVADYDQAQPIFERLLERNPNHSKANEFMGNILFNAGDYEQAIAYYQRAVDIDQSAYSYYGLGRSLQKLSNNRGAFEAYQKAVARNPRFAEAYPYYGEVALRIGERDVAVEALEQAKILGSADADSLSFLCLVYGNLSNFESAIPNCEQSLKQDSTNGQFAGRYAHVLILMNQPQEALRISQLATQLAPEDSLGFRTLGDAYRLLGDVDNARNAYQQALTLFPDNALALEGLSKLNG